LRHVEEDDKSLKLDEGQRLFETIDLGKLLLIEGFLKSLKIREVGVYY